MPLASVGGSGGGFPRPPPVGGGGRVLREPALDGERVAEPSRERQDDDDRHDGAQDEHAVRQSSLLRAIAQTVYEKWQAEQKAEEGDQRAARNPLPLVETDFVDRPDESQRQRERVNPEPCL